MRILVLGAGGTGGYYGGKLARAGIDVSFLVRTQRAAQLARDGLVVRGPQGDFSVAVASLTAEALPDAVARQAFDLVLLSCKAYDLDSAIAAIAPAMGPQTTLLPILNGLRHYAVLDARFGRNAVLRGLCHISVTKAADGSIHHLGRLERLTFGECDGRISARVQALAALCQRAGIDCLAATDVRQALWDKYSFLAALAAGTCLLKAGVGEIVATRGGRAFMLALHDECLAVAAAAGHPIPETAQQAAAEMLTRPDSTLKASMLRDLEAGHATEGAHILGDMVERAHAHGLDVPRLEAASCCLQVVEAQRLALGSAG